MSAPESCLAGVFIAWVAFWFWADAPEDMGTRFSAVIVAGLIGAALGRIAFGKRP